MRQYDDEHTRGHASVIYFHARHTVLCCTPFRWWHRRTDVQEIRLGDCHAGVCCNTTCSSDTSMNYTKYLLIHIMLYIFVEEGQHVEWRGREEGQMRTVIERLRRLDVCLYH